MIGDVGALARKLETLPARPWSIGGSALGSTWTVIDRDGKRVCTGIMCKPTAEFIIWAANNFQTVSVAPERMCKTCGGQGSLPIIDKSFSEKPPSGQTHIDKISGMTFWACEDCGGTGETKL